MRNRNKLRLYRRRRKRKRASIPFVVPWNKTPTDGITMTLAESDFDWRSWMELCIMNSAVKYVTFEKGVGKARHNHEHDH